MVFAMEAHARANQPQIRSRELLRLAPLLLYVLLAALLAVALWQFGWTPTWTSLSVPTMSPEFADMLALKSAVISSDLGADIRWSTPADPWKRPFNFPLVWVDLARAVGLANGDRYLWAAGAVVLTFAAVCASLLYRFPSFGLLATLVSTATLLGIERGNTDLIIFCVLFLAAMLPRGWPAVPILVVTALKLYPVAALMGLVLRREFAWFAASVVAAAAIFAWLGNELIPIKQTTVPFWAVTYGFPGLAAFFEHFAMPASWFFSTVAAVAAATIALTMAFYRSGVSVPPDTPTFSFFMTGALIHVESAILSSNWDYRLIFLILCVPFLQTRPFRGARAFVWLIVLTMNTTVIVHFFREAGVAAGWVCKLAVFTVLCAYLSALGLRFVFGKQIAVARVSEAM